jgi:hypothetical protein
MIEQITYLLFLHRLDDVRWSRREYFAPGDMYAVIGEHVCPLLRNDLARRHAGDRPRFRAPLPQVRSLIYVSGRT